MNNTMRQLADLRRFPDPGGNLRDKEPEVTEDMIDAELDKEGIGEYILELMNDAGPALGEMLTSIATGDHDPVYELEKWGRAIVKAKIERDMF